MTELRADDLGGDLSALHFGLAELILTALAEDDDRAYRMAVRNYRPYYLRAERAEIFSFVNGDARAFLSGITHEGSAAFYDGFELLADGACGVFFPVLSVGGDYGVLVTDKDCMREGVFYRSGKILCELTQLADG